MSDFHSFTISTARKPHISCQDLVEKYCYESREEEWSADWIYDWLYEECCMKCSKKDECESSVFRCDLVLTYVYHFF